MEKDCVNDAFDILLDELESVIKDLNKEGAEAFSKQRYEKEVESLRLNGIELKNFKIKLENLQSEWNQKFDNFSKKKVKVETVRTIPSHKKSTKTKLKIIFENGETIQENKAYLTFAKALYKFGFRKILALNLNVRGLPLVSKTKAKTKYKQYELEGYYITTHSSTDEKRNMLELIAKELNQQIEVQII